MSASDSVIWAVSWSAAVTKAPILKYCCLLRRRSRCGRHRCSVAVFAAGLRGFASLHTAASMASVVSLCLHLLLGILGGSLRCARCRGAWLAARVRGPLPRAETRSTSTAPGLPTAGSPSCSAAAGPGPPSSYCYGTASELPGAAPLSAVAAAVGSNSEILTCLMPVVWALGWQAKVPGAVVRDTSGLIETVI